MCGDRKGAIACVDRDSSIPNIFPFFYQVQELGLQEAYGQDRGTHFFVRKLMALPFLPAERNQNTISSPTGKKATTEALKTFTAYIEKTRITGDTFPPTTWSVYMHAVRTNNDLEGWHNALNRRAKGKAQLLLYVFIQLLHKEASLVAIQIRLVSDKRLRRHQRKTYKKLKTRLFKLRHQYENKERNSKQLLEACSYLVKI